MRRSLYKDRMRYFGNWRISGELHTATPVGMACIHCEELITEDDSGVLMPHVNLGMMVTIGARHRECYLWHIFGSIGHQRRLCSCYGGTLEDPPELTARQAARVAVEYFESRQLFELYPNPNRHEGNT